MAFNLKFNTNSPNTPNRKGKGSSFFSGAPSTTPKGPPPSHLTSQSFTPAGNPPRSSQIFGSSYNPANNTFGRRNTPGKRAFAVPESSPPPDDDDDDMDEDVEGEAVSPEKSAFLSSAMADSPRGLKRSRDGQVRPPPAGSGMADIARSYAGRSAPAQLSEPDDVILRSEENMASLDVTVHERAAVDRDETIVSSVAQLTKLAKDHSIRRTKLGSIGPDSEDPLSRATYVSTLLLQLHHPHSTKAHSARSASKSQRALALSKESQSDSIALPRALLDWLNEHHTPLPDEFDEIHLYQPSPAAHESFWDQLGAELIRGRFARAIRLLKDAGWQNAATAQDDGGRRGRGYEGKQLENTEEVSERCIHVLESCPAVRYDDWDIKGAEWSLFRQRVRHAIKDLEVFANGSLDEDDAEQPAQEENVFARSMNGGFASMSASTTRASSRVPWTIYENLKFIYGVLLGSDEVVDYAQDWLEASILLTVWWDGEEGPNPNVGLHSQRSLRKSTRASTREVDITPLVAYRRRLASMFRNVTSQIEESSFQPDTLDPVQLGLACVLDDSVDAVISMLRTWSQTVAATTVEIAALGGWLPQSGPNGRGLMQQGFSSEDLMVLSHGPGQQRQEGGDINRDEVLSEYADLLAAREVFRGSDGKIEKEGWELAVSVLGRLDDNSIAQSKIAGLLDAMEFSEEARVDKVLRTCSETGLIEQARVIAERYADSLAESSTQYGVAIIYYARAHATQKLKATLALLTSFCLLQSAAIPGSSNLDAQLAGLLSRERTALVSLARVDTEAAALLSSHLSGYATMRRFYDLRDQDVNPQASTKLRPLERKREAAKALIAVAESASDCIRGGLFDPDIESVVPVDGLLALLGEALPLLGSEKRILTEQQVFSLMAIVEDLSTVSGRIRDGAEGLLKASMNAYRGGAKSLSGSKSQLSSASGTLGGSSWDMLASSVMQRSAGGGKGKAVEVQRGWDWRKGLDAVGGVDVGSKEVLMLLRTALAREVASGWSGAIVW